MAPDGELQVDENTEGDYRKYASFSLGGARGQQDYVLGLMNGVDSNSILGGAGEIRTKWQSLVGSQAVTPSPECPTFS